MLIFRMWLCAWVCLFWPSSRLTRRQWTVTYQYQSFMNHSSIPECNYKCETQNSDPEIWPNRYSQTQRNLRVDGYRSSFGPLCVSRSGFRLGLERKQHVLAVHIWTVGGLPGPIANTTPTAPFHSHFACVIARYTFAVLCQITIPSKFSYLHMMARKCTQLFLSWLHWADMESQSRRCRIYGKERGGFSLKLQIW